VRIGGAQPTAADLAFQGRPSYGADTPADRGTEIRERVGLKPGGYVLWVGRLVPENAPDQFLEGVRLSGIDAPTVVVGDATYQDEYKQALRANAPANAIFTGYQFGSAYHQPSAHADLYVLAAGVEGTHPVLVEQMAAGNAILARETASNYEVLDDAGLFWSTPAELGQLIREAWSDSERRKPPWRLRPAARFGALQLEISNHALPGALRALPGLTDPWKSGRAPDEGAPPLTL